MVTVDRSPPGARSSSNLSGRRSAGPSPARRPRGRPPRAARATVRSPPPPRQSCMSRRERGNVASRRDVILRDQIVIRADAAAVVRGDERVEGLKDLRRVVAGDLEWMRARRTKAIPIAEEA